MVATTSSKTNIHSGPVRSIRKRQNAASPRLRIPRKAAPPRPAPRTQRRGEPTMRQTRFARTPFAIMTPTTMRICRSVSPEILASIVRASYQRRTPPPSHSRHRPTPIGDGVTRRRDWVPALTDLGPLFARVRLIRTLCSGKHSTAPDARRKFLLPTQNISSAASIPSRCCGNASKQGGFRCAAGGISNEIPGQ